VVFEPPSPTRGYRPNPKRLGKSVNILTQLNNARHRWLTVAEGATRHWVAGEVLRLERLLGQHDADCRNRVRAEQMTLLDRPQS
jgi:hypothetical protein